MSSSGKTLRLRRLLDPRTRRTVIVPLDHGVSNGPIAGIEDARTTVDHVRRGGATAVVLHKGLVRTVLPAVGEMGVLVHISASTALNPDPNDKRLVSDVEACLRLGADAVSVHVNVGARTESQQVADLGLVADACDAWGVPLLAMMYPRGHEIEDPHDLTLVKHVARLGAELGADVLKVPYTGSVASFREVVRSCPQPVVVSGGPRATGDRDFLRMVWESVQAGGAGVSIGRNIWQHPDPVAVTKAVSEIVMNGADVERAALHLKG